MKKRNTTQPNPKNNTMPITNFHTQSFSQALKTLKPQNIHCQKFEQYVNNLYHLKTSTEALKTALIHLSQNPDRLKNYPHRASFIEWAEKEVEAGEQILQLFAVDTRYETALDWVKEMSKAYIGNPYSWEDFFRFHEGVWQVSKGEGEADNG